MSDDRDIQGAKAAEILDRMFVGEEVASHDVVSAVQCARSDDEVRDHYNRLAIADREFGGELEERVGEAWFLDSLDDMLGEEANAGAESESAPVVSLDEYRVRRPVGAMLAMAALVMFGIAGVLGLQARRPPPEFQARSTATPRVSPYDAPNFEVFCVRRDGGDVTFRGRDESEFATVRCPVDGEVKFAISSTDPNLRYVAFFGISSDNTLYWYGPSPAARSSIAIEPSDTLQPVGETIRLNVNHAPGTVRVIGLFAERPLDFDDVSLFVRSNLWRLHDGGLTIDGGTVVRQTFEVSGP